MPAPAESARRGRILITDDDADFRALLRTVLESKGHTVLEAEDGSKAFLLAAQEKPDLIILDMVMPGISGATSLRLMEVFRRTTLTPVLFVTAGGVDDPALAQALRMPGTRMLHKPLDWPEFHRQLQQMLAEAA